MIQQATWVVSNFEGYLIATLDYCTTKFSICVRSLVLDSPVFASISCVHLRFNQFMRSLDL